MNKPPNQEEATCAALRQIISSPRLTFSTKLDATLKITCICLLFRGSYIQCSLWLLSDILHTPDLCPQPRVSP